MPRQPRREGMSIDTEKVVSGLTLIAKYSPGTVSYGLSCSRIDTVLNRFIEVGHLLQECMFSEPPVKRYMNSEPPLARGTCILNPLARIACILNPPGKECMYSEPPCMSRCWVYSVEYRRNISEHMLPSYQVWLRSLEIIHGEKFYYKEEEGMFTDVEGQKLLSFVYIY